MKKLFISIGVIAAFAVCAYAAQNRNASQTVSTEIASNEQVPTTTVATSVATSVGTSAQTKASTAAAAKFKNGTYTGSAADAYFGTVQVQAVVSGGKLAQVNVLQYPTDRGTSREISAMSLPTLKSEAIQSQSASVDAVSGATQTSQAFDQSLGSALAMAAN